MKHKLNCCTKYGGWVCKYLRYFDTEEELNAHIQIENSKLGEQ